MKIFKNQIVEIVLEMEGYDLMFDVNYKKFLTYFLASKENKFHDVSNIYCALNNFI